MCLELLQVSTQCCPAVFGLSVGIQAWVLPLSPGRDVLCQLPRPKTTPLLVVFRENWGAEQDPSPGVPSERPLKAPPLLGFAWEYPQCPHLAVLGIHCLSVSLSVRIIIQDALCTSLGVWCSGWISADKKHTLAAGALG